MSMIQSAAAIVSSSCSTTMIVLPRSRRRISVSISLVLSRWCRPMLGSSRMYSTPVRPEPICVASRMRCASPPARVARGPVQRQIAQADVEQEAEARPDLLDDLPPDDLLPVGQVQRLEPAVRLLDAQGAQVADVDAAEQHGQRFRLQPLALADGAGLVRSGTAPAIP